MKRNIFFREAGLAIQPLLFWLGASPDGLICDKEYNDHPGLLEIKCPSNSRNFSPADLLGNQSFYLQQNNNGEIPKFRWLWGYRKLIIVIFVLAFKCMITSRVEFNDANLDKLILKFKEFY